MRKLLFTPVAFDQYNQWQQEDKTVFTKLKNYLQKLPKHPLKEPGNRNH